MLFNLAHSHFPRPVWFGGPKCMSKLKHLLVRARKRFQSKLKIVYTTPRECLKQSVHLSSFPKLNEWICNIVNPFSHLAEISAIIIKFLFSVQQFDSVAKIETRRSFFSISEEWWKLLRDCFFHILYRKNIPEIRSSHFPLSLSKSLCQRKSSHFTY